MKGCWGPSIKLHQHKPHCKSVGHHHNGIHWLVPDTEIDRKDGFEPPGLDPIVDIRARFSSWKSVPEPTNLFLLLAKLSKVISLNISKLLLPYSFSSELKVTCETCLTCSVGNVAFVRYSVPLTCFRCLFVRLDAQRLGAWPKKFERFV